jgi:hypothetical protein
MPLVTKSAYARSRGCTPAAVTTAIKSGRIKAAVVIKDGKELLDLDKANDLWARNTQQQPPSTQTPTTPGKPPADRDIRAFIEGLPEDEIPELNWSRARREHYGAEREKIGALREREAVGSLSEVRTRAAKLARQVRDLLLIIPSRNAARLAAMSNPEDVRALLEQEIEGALKGLKDA